jgi:hypothetical protein
MNIGLVEEIAVKSSALPIAKQREVLELVNRLAMPPTSSEIDLQSVENKKPPFQSVRGILNRKLEHLEEDLAEIRQEMWQSFPRDFSEAQPK